LRIIHTADWHLGHRLGPFARDHEHATFLGWLLDMLDQHQADALFVCGDVFDRGNPSAEALQQFYRFVADARRRMPALQLVFIGGNHDAPARLEAPAPVLESLRTVVRGAVPRDAHGAIDASACSVDLRGKSGEVEARALLVPFVRPIDLGGHATTTALCDALVQHARAATPNDLPLLALAHGEASGASFAAHLSPDSERRVLGGELSPDAFAPASYVALGHLHFAQAVAGHPHMRYSGSPLPLSMAERDYRHAVALVDLSTRGVDRVQELPTPRTVEMRRIGHDAASLDEVMAAIATIATDDMPLDRRPFIDVRVAGVHAGPQLRHHVEVAVEGRAARLVRVSTGRREISEPSLPAGALVDTTPEEMLSRLYQSRHGVGAHLPDALRDAFRELAAEAADVDDRAEAA
jgi:exonuclease SbcD